MKIWILIFLILLTTLVANADNIPAPPPLKDMPVELQHYLRSIYENLHRLPVTTTNPNGSREGKKGDMVLYDSTNNYLMINTDSSTTWSGAQLIFVP
jgi:hypothetical protein